MAKINRISFIVRNDPALLQNRIFSGEPLYGMKSDNYPFISLQSELMQRGIEFSTHDVLPPASADAIICLDEVNSFNCIGIKDKPSYLIISEPPIYSPANWEQKNHKPFRKVFTYDMSLCTNDRYVHYVFPIDFSAHQAFENVSYSLFQHRKMCCLIAGAMLVSPEKETSSLLHERFLVADYFSKFYHHDFDIYGRNLINEKFEHFTGASLLKKINLNFAVRYIASKKAANIKKSYQGSIPPLKKLEFHNKYNFSICYDNSAINGCISERIFDCFVSKTVPVYRGALDIDKYIPADCFIDARRFNSFNDLYHTLKNMNFQTYLEYLNNAHDFLQSHLVEKFKVSNYVKTIIKNIEIE
ncbi:MAG: glycosyltransferase family 10 domain-containing protein [Flammeovirgaceae bacterium]